MIEPKLVDPVELEVGEAAEGAALSSRTACSGAFCASKQHQSIMSSIQRHIGGAIRQPGMRFCRVYSNLPSIGGASVIVDCCAIQSNVQGT